MRIVDVLWYAAKFMCYICQYFDYFFKCSEQKEYWFEIGKICAKMQILLMLLVFHSSGVLCDVVPYLFPPSYDNVIIANNNVTEVICPELDNISDGNYVIQTLSATQKVAVFTCNPGYDMEGTSNLYCMGGQWEPYVLPQCITKRCLPPPHVKDGIYDIDTDRDNEGYYPKGTVVSYSCKKGYHLKPLTSKLRVCVHGIWTGPEASCVYNNILNPGCPVMRSIKNGYFIPDKVKDLDGYTTGVQVLHICKGDYTLIGHKVQKCLEDGTWSPKTQPTCVLTKEIIDDMPCGALPIIPHTYTQIFTEILDRRYLTDVTVMISCKKKYRNSKNPCQSQADELKCVDGKWVGDQPTCVLARECFPPPEISNGVIGDLNYIPFDEIPKNFPLGFGVTYQCMPGFIMEGPSVMSCDIGGCWFPNVTPPRCSPKDSPARESSDDNFLLEVDNISALLISAAAGAGVLGILLLICLMVACRRKKQITTTVTIPQPLPRQDLGDHAVLLEHPDRLALIAFADGVQRNQENLLPSYDEVMRNERGATLSAARPYRPHWPNLAGRRTRNSPNPDIVHVTRHGSFASHTPSTRSAGDSMGSTDTMAISEGSTNVTLDTASSHSGSQPASCRAHCGSLASFDACSVVNTEDVPLLEESELEEIQGGANDMDNPIISDNSSLKVSTNSADILSV